MMARQNEVDAYLAAQSAEWQRERIEAAQAGLRDAQAGLRVALAARREARARWRAADVLTVRDARFLFEVADDDADRAAADVRAWERELATAQAGGE